MPGRFLGMPATKTGWRSIRLESVFVLMFGLNMAIQLLVFDKHVSLEQSLFPFYFVYVMAMLIAGMAGGVLGFITILRQQEHSLLVWLSTFVGIFVFLLVLNELVQLVIFLLGG
jgi:hypothetical protein